MKFKQIKKVNRSELELAGKVKSMVEVALLHKPIMPERLRLSIGYQFEFPIVFEKNQRYYAFANFLPLISLCHAESDSITVVVVDYEPSLLVKIAANYILHLTSYQAAYPEYFPFFSDVISLNLELDVIPDLSGCSLSQRALAKLLEVERQTIRTYLVNR